MRRFCTCPACGTTHDILTCYRCHRPASTNGSGLTDALGQRIILCTACLVSLNAWMDRAVTESPPPSSDGPIPSKQADLVGETDA